MISCNESEGIPADVIAIAAQSLAIITAKFVGTGMTEAGRQQLRGCIARQVKQDFGVVLSTTELDSVVKRFVDFFTA